IPGITEISASSSLGNTSIVLQFDLSRNIDAAAADVQAAISVIPGMVSNCLISGVETEVAIVCGEAPLNCAETLMV
ncbi:hypothetical protein ACC684_39710, partial [Rhizobium ruizarguesonis]